MKPVVIGDDVWLVRYVSPLDPALVDRTGNLSAATTDPINKTISISSVVIPPFLDKVILHEISHALMISHGVSVSLRSSLPSGLYIFIDELLSNVIENYSIEAAYLASQSLNRPLCINGYCAF